MEISINVYNIAALIQRMDDKEEAKPFSQLCMIFLNYMYVRIIRPSCC